MSDPDRRQTDRGPLLREDLLVRHARIRRADLVEQAVPGLTHPCAYCAATTAHGTKTLENPSIAVRYHVTVCLTCGTIREVQNEIRPYTR
jgi:hypothetical protein